ncbi:MarR family winged helix-turn-helix transcriptional regulator [Kitasatospora sp. NBC_00240]|uniref:MarR family winged helix-turn-helix transcriptional regulator n=1 Tax=Kitasatospora sp. NBC_00240 TaxID=2903567 RepID=UPI00225A35EA|nr:MarR family winged helix-turn-helix transcriptional regulator [Kitasatospora sp. NBC_00240]MCX5208004.1 MarR family winged helix-turn-helix transcriptional regulator [Kitasatospora sp. NBC_00240]
MTLPQQHAPVPGPETSGEDDGDRQNERRELGRLLQGLASEMNLLGHDFAASQGLHATDVQALLAVMRGAGPGQAAGPGAGPGPQGGTGPDAEAAAVTPGLLREELGITSGAVTAVLDRLERAGHVHRSRDSADRRQVRVHYNPGASRIATAWFTPVAERTDIVRADFTPAELQVVARFLGRMTEELAGLRQERRTRPEAGPETRSGARPDAG